MTNYLRSRVTETLTVYQLHSLRIPYKINQYFRSRLSLDK